MSKARDLTGGAEDRPRAERIILPAAAKKAGVYAGIALLVFLLGLVPMWLKAREAGSQRDAARRELRLSRLQGTLASAAIDARRGEYEPARQTASDFFTALRAQLEAGEDSALPRRQREAAAPLLARRDHVITLLARGDPAAAEQLTDLYVAYRQVLDGPQNR